MASAQRRPIDQSAPSLVAGRQTNPSHVKSFIPIARGSNLKGMKSTLLVKPVNGGSTTRADVAPTHASSHSATDASGMGAMTPSMNALQVQERAHFFTDGVAVEDKENVNIVWTSASPFPGFKKEVTGGDGTKEVVYWPAAKIPKFRPIKRDLAALAVAKSREYVPSSKFEVPEIVVTCADGDVREPSETRFATEECAEQSQWQDIFLVANANPDTLSLGSFAFGKLQQRIDTAPTVEEKEYWTSLLIHAKACHGGEVVEVEEKVEEIVAEIDEVAKEVSQIGWEVAGIHEEVVQYHDEVGRGVEELRLRQEQADKAAEEELGGGPLHDLAVEEAMAPYYEQKRLKEKWKVRHETRERMKWWKRYEEERRVQQVKDRLLRQMQEVEEKAAKAAQLELDKAFMRKLDEVEERRRARAAAMRAAAGGRVLR